VPHDAAPANIKTVILHRFIDPLLHRRHGCRTRSEGVCSINTKNMYGLRIDHAIAANGAAPFQFAE